MATKTNQRARAATESLSFLAITAGILVLANFLVQFASVRIDCTANDLFSLSDGSKRLAGSLTDDMEIKAYFTEDLPPPFHDTRRYVADILAEYEAASNGKIRVEFINPDTDAEREAADEAGIVQVEHAALQDDSTNVVRGYRGLVMRYLDQSEVIPVVQDTSGLEYALTMKIKKMVGERRPVGVLGGHEGPSLTEGLSKLQNCLPTYDLREVQGTEDIDPELAALIIVEPQTNIPEEELRRIDSYVVGGGSLGIFGGSMKIELAGMEPQATPVDSGLNTLLRPWGVVMEQGIVHDARCGRAPLRTQIGMLPVPHPPVPIVSFDDAQSEHPVVFRLSSSPLPFTSALEVTEVADDLEDVTVTTLMASSEDSWNVATPTVSLRPRAPREWPQNGESGPFPLAVAIEGRVPSAFGGEGESAQSADDDVQVLIVGGSFFMRDEALPEAQQGAECQLSSHLAFALNAIDWLAQDSDLIAIRAKNVEEPSIEVPHDVREAEDEAREAATEAIDAVQEGDRETAEGAIQEREEALERRKAALEKWESTKGLYRWGNMLGIPLLFALFGLLRWQSRMNKRRNLKL